MADSKIANSAAVAEAEWSLVTNAMAWRVKYRRVDGNGKVIKFKTGVGFLGVHQKNRGAGCIPLGNAAGACLWTC